MTYPKIADGLVFSRTPEGYVVEGGPAREMLAGRTARELLPMLLPLLDGTRTVDQIAEAIGVSSSAAWRVVNVMAPRGLLRTFPRPPEEHDDPSAMRTFLSRSIPCGRGECVHERLLRATVDVVGPAPLAELIASLLRQSDIGTVEWLPDAPSASRRNKGGRAASLVVHVGNRPAKWPPGSREPRLPVRFSENSVSIGPLFNVPGGACPRCSSDDDGEPGRDARQSGLAAPGSGSALGVAAGVASGAVLRVLGGYGVSPVFRHVIDVFPDGYRTERPVKAGPDCPECGRPGLSLERRELDEFNYELSVESPPSASDLYEARYPKNEHPISPKFYLTEPRVRPPHNAKGAECLRELWSILSACLDERPAGPAGSPALRQGAASAARPTGTHAYVIGELTGAGPRIHYFDGRSREFVVLPGRVPSGRPHPVSVLLTGDLSVTTPRFGEQARRMIYQDAGLTAAHIDTRARGCGWRAHVRDDEIGDLPVALGIDPARETVAAVIDLAPDSARPAAAPRMPGRSDGEPANAQIVMRLAGQGLSGADEIWRTGEDPGPHVGCVLYARTVSGLPRGLYSAVADPGLRPLRASDNDIGQLETYFLDRGIDPVALLLFTGDLGGTLAARGAPGYRALVAKASAAAGLVQLLATGAGLGTDMLPRLPPALAASTGKPGDQARVFYGCTLRRPSAESRSEEPRYVTW